MEKASALTAMIRQYPDLNRLSEPEVKEILEGSPLSKSEVDRLHSSTNKGRFYADRLFWHDMSDAKAALYELNTHFQDNKVLTPIEFSNSVQQLVTTLNETPITCEIWKQAPGPELMKRGREEIRQSHESFGEVDRLARAELDLLRTFPGEDSGA